MKNLLKITETSLQCLIVGNICFKVTFGTSKLLFWDEILYNRIFGLVVIQLFLKYIRWVAKLSFSIIIDGIKIY